jgi:hypothetical protein
MKKMKRFVSAQKLGFGRRGEGSSGIQSQEGQVSTAASDASSLITKKRSDP